MADRDYSLFGDAHVEKYLATDGAEGHLWNGVPCLVLWTTGRKTGETRVHPLIYGLRGDDVVIVASKGGAPEHPTWYLNLVANPTVEVQVEADTPAPAPAAPPQLDASLLQKAQAEHEAGAVATDVAESESESESEPASNGATRPQLRAKGLDRSVSQKPLTYSAPELGEDTPSITHDGGDADATAKSGTSSARRQQARRNPNRGSRGNKRKR